MVTWKQKLELTNNLVDKYKLKSEFKTSGLAILAAYLYFINSGQITCGD